MVPVALVVLSSTAASGQSVWAGLVPIQEGTVDAAAPFAGDVDVLDTPGEFEAAGGRAVDVCLDAGAFVIVVERYPTSRTASGVVAPDRALQDGWEATGFVDLARTEERGSWGWTLVKLAAPACVRVGVVGGRARLFRMRIGADF